MIRECRDYRSGGTSGGMRIAGKDGARVQLQKLMRVVPFDREAGQTRDPWVAKDGTLRAARPDCLRLRSGRALTAQKTLVRNDNQTAALPGNDSKRSRQVITINLP